MEDLLTFPAGKDARGAMTATDSTETYRKVDGHWLIDSLVLTRFRMDKLENWTPDA
ncbi:hypothetical protein [Amycolatopsis sp. NPDC050768]|uniref:hypothetical protein n=1 Tax=Amycolatopsis sp. NPDC050768 TaxID=3154839 RepID=UPI0033E5464E